MSDLPSRLATLVDELKRRGVLRVAAVYLVSAWLLIQVADVTFPRLGLPDWTITFVIVFGALLFPVVVGLAWVFDFTHRGLQRTAPLPDTAEVPADASLDGAALPARTARPHRPHATILTAALMAIPLIAFGLWWVNDARGYTLDENLAVVMPFRVAGANADAHFLREGLMDLIAARIGGGAGEMQVVAPRTVSRRLREELGSLDADPDRSEALALARDLGAGRLLEGEVVGGGGRITVTATLYDVFSGRRIGEPATVVAHPDSLHGLVDQLATRLVAAGSGVSGDRLAHLTTASLPALRAFLDAEQAFRRGRHADALRGYDEAVTLDTTFALAALGLIRAQGWTVGTASSVGWPRAEQIVRRGLDRLSAADRRYYQSFTGGGTRASLTEFIELRLRAAEEDPADAGLRFLAGDALFHWGTAIGMSDARERSRRFLEEVVAMDSAYLEPLMHLMDLANASGDTLAMQRHGDRLLAIDSISRVALNTRYRRSIGVAGERMRGERFDLDTLGNTELLAMLTGGISYPAREELLQKIVTRLEGGAMPGETMSMASAIDNAGMRTGRPSLRAFARSRARLRPEIADIERIAYATYWLRDADSVSAAAAGVRDRLASLRAEGAADPLAVYARECLLGQAALAEGDWNGALASATTLDTMTIDVEVDWSEAEGRPCVAFLRTAVAVYRGDADASRRLELFDDTLRSGVPRDEWSNQILQLATARLWEHAGRPERALAAVRRRIYLPPAVMWHTEMVGEEARLADQLGLRREAIDAYRSYLAFMEHAEPPFRERADRARERLAALAGER